MWRRRPHLCSGAGSKTVTVDYFNDCELRKQEFFTVLVK